MTESNQNLIKEFEYRLQGYKSKLSKNPNNELFAQMINSTESMILELKKKLL
jgi:hypothetical protein